MAREHLHNWRNWSNSDVGAVFPGCSMTELNSFFDCEAILFVVCDSTHSRRDALWAT